MKPLQHYTVEEGLLYAGEYPGSLAAELTLPRLEELVGKGVRSFIDLTLPGDLLEGYEELLPQLDPGGALGLRRYAHGIPDLGVPSSPAVMRGILDRLREERDAGRACYVHCWAGIGRTGTVIACWLREGGMDAHAALEEVQRLYFHGMAKSALHPRSPQTAAQVRYVREWSG